jgi:hypothetical protein
VEGKKKYHLSNWESMAKDFGGLGVPGLRDLNICLLASWVKRYHFGDGKLWKELIDYKYPTSQPNILCTRETNSSQFFKGFMWAARAASVGYRWKIGNGKRVRFWEDNWLGHSSLAVQFWDLYIVVNGKTGNVADLWDGHNLKCTFRRTVDSRLGRVWLEIVQIASTFVFSEEEDALIWKFNSNEIYSSQSLYRIINFRGVTPVHSPSIWTLRIPPRVQFFLWLLTKNKNLTRDNLAKRQKVEDKTCLFCEETETSQHLFFNCAVAKEMWRRISVVLHREVGGSFESIGACWLSNKRFLSINVITSAALWALWKLRNELCFQNIAWKSMECLLMKAACLAQNWLILCPKEKKEELKLLTLQVSASARNPKRLQG